ncbi:uncharacterized protein TrAtP1_003982 [Trichoderma atroviride]|uniref:uncharacterized protein n=1 Tax=Hypocrea atroviridis TaxID=63577 RepID=UPI0033318832|nr:hypothetical protein TrAtP1_003982 [Trichoderma atroviride]
MAAVTASPPLTSASPGSPTQRDSVSIRQSLSPPRKPVAGTIRKPVPQLSAADDSERSSFSQEAPISPGQTDSQQDAEVRPLSLGLDGAPQLAEGISFGSLADFGSQSQEQSFGGLLSTPISGGLDLQLPFIEASQRQSSQDDASSPAIVTSPP